MKVKAPMASYSRMPGRRGLTYWPYTRIPRPGLFSGGRVVVFSSGGTRCLPSEAVPRGGLRWGCSSRIVGLPETPRTPDAKTPRRRTENRRAATNEKFEASVAYSVAKIYVYISSMHIVSNRRIPDNPEDSRYTYTNMPLFTSTSPSTSSPSSPSWSPSTRAYSRPSPHPQPWASRDAFATAHRTGPRLPHYPISSPSPRELYCRCALIRSAESPLYRDSPSILLGFCFRIHTHARGNSRARG